MTGSSFYRNYGFLEEVRREFTAEFSMSRITSARAYELEKSFSRALSNLLHYYNTHPNAGSTEASVVALTAQAEDLKNVVGANVNLLLKRGDCLETLVTKADELESQSRVFRKNTKQAKQIVKVKYRKMQFIQCVIGSGIVMLVAMVVWALVSRVRHTGGSSSSSHSSSSSSYYGN